MLKKYSFFLGLSILLSVATSSVFAGEKVTITLSGPEQAAPGTEIVVTAHISKGAIQGFAKFQAELSDGLVAKELDSKNSSFTFVDQKAKFIWMTLPAEADYQISFRVSVAASMNGNATINGIFSYVENNETSKAKSNTLTIGIGTEIAKPSPTKTVMTELVDKKPDAPAVTIATVPDVKPVITPSVTTSKSESSESKTSSPENKVVPVEPPSKNNNNSESGNEIKNEAQLPVIQDAPAPTPVPVPVTTPVSTQEVKPIETKEVAPVVSVINSKGSSKIPAENKTVNTDKPVSSSTTSSSVPKSSGIIFRVQIGVSQNASGKDSLQSKFNIQQEIYSESISGKYKFTSGSFKEYSQARDFRNEMKQKGLEGPFIVAFKNGVQLNLQDALKESNQKWVP